jgi:hypothetical protein
VGAGVDWIPEQDVLHFRNDHNGHNRDWLHADGYVSRPYVLPVVTVTFRDFSFDAGAFLAAGLEPLPGIPTRYYLAMPAPLLHSQHYDKGFRFAYAARWLQVDASVINGDWMIGERDLFALSNSAHNSYPSYAANARIDLGGAYLGATGTIGDSGSYPGEKRRQNNLVAYLGGRRAIGRGELEARGFVAYLGRNPQGDGDGRHVEAVETLAFGLEADYRFPHLDFYGELWEMGRSDHGPDGEIWIRENDRAWGWGAGIRWKDPLSITSGNALYLGLFYGYLEFGDRESLVIFDVGLNF